MNGWIVQNKTEVTTMTSVFDQYEEGPQQSTSGAMPARGAPPAASGYVTVPLADNTPIFSKQKMNLNPRDSITHAAVASDYLVLAMANGMLFRMDLRQADKNSEINYSKFAQPNTRLTGIFLDPLGQHLLMSFAPRNKSESYPELLYLHRGSDKPSIKSGLPERRGAIVGESLLCASEPAWDIVQKAKAVNKSRNYEVTEVGWNYENTSLVNTGAILLGTSQGHILETEFALESDKMYQTGWRHVFDIGKGTDTPITGIEFHRVHSTNKYFIIVTTPKRLYPFIGNANQDEKPLLQPIFNNYLAVPETGFQEIFSNLKYSKLQFWYDRNKKIPKTFAWLTEPGIFHGELDPTCQHSNSLFKNGELLSYPEEGSGSKDKVLTPLDFVLTEFHALIMYPDKVKAICLLNQELIYEDIYSESRGKLKTIIKDPIKQSIWAVTDKSVFRYKVSREERNVWKIYCDKRQFDLAKEYCGNNPAYIDSINVKQAELLFSQGEYERSGSIYADTQSSFETICLKFLEADQVDALKIYLGKRLDKLADDEKTLISMVVIWMTELYLSQLGALRRSGQENTNKYTQLQSDFEIFLLQTKVRKCMPHVKHVIYELLASHGDKDNFTKLTIINEDFENVVFQHIQRKSFLEALDVLKNQKTPTLFYQFAPVLMQEIPKHTVNALIAQGSKLSPTKLLPALLSCDNNEQHITEITRYLEFMVQHFLVKDRAIHNYLLTLYAEYDTDALMRYLSRQGQELSEVKFDVHYALRLCHEKGLTKACVKLSALLGLWESAVELALSIDLQLAKDIANMPDEQDELKKRLWLKIAEHVISEKQDVGEAMKFLEECPLIKIEDILPFFSDVVTIDHFRQPICQSLQEYNNQIEDLKTEMEEATRSADQVRSEIQSFRNRSVIVSVSDVCCLCDIVLLLRPFYLFPCGHKFHNDCLLAEMKPLLGPAKRNKLEDLQRQLNTLSHVELKKPTSSGLPLHEQLRNDADDIVAGECVFCGEYTIQAIDKPFIADEDWDRVMKEWE